jgi:hypothetical protein
MNIGGVGRVARLVFTATTMTPTFARSATFGWSLYVATRPASIADDDRRHLYLLWYDRRIDSAEPDGRANATEP